jgi:hypothetical protein
MFDVGYFPPNTPPAEPVGWVEPTGPAQSGGPMTGSVKPIAAAAAFQKISER